jgi:hypothetical protein
MITFRRRIAIAGDYAAGDSAGLARVRAALEDDFHHFRVEIRCRAGTIDGVDGHALRYPYTMCPNAAQPLRRLIGMALSSLANSVTRHTDATEQCTHMFELAGLAMAAAARGITHREYRIEVPMRIDDCTMPRLWRDGEALLHWQVAGNVIEGPEPYGQRSMQQGLARWALTHLPEDEAEAALVLRRATAISIGRTKQLDAQQHAVSTGFCYSQQASRAEHALRMVGSTLDFTTGGAALCAGDAAWLAFDEALPPPASPAS